MTSLSTTIQNPIAAWTRPAIVAVLLLGLGWWTHSAIKREIEAHVESALVSLRDADVKALTVWLDEQEARADAISKSPRFSAAIEHLVVAEPGTSEPPSAAELRESLGNLCRRLGNTGYFVADRSGRVASGLPDALAGAEPFVGKEDKLRRVLEGEVVTVRPFMSDSVPDDEGNLRRAPVMFVAAPVRAADDLIVGVVGLLIDPRDRFSRILKVARMGESGETYAFDRDGLLLSKSRFNKHLKEIGLLRANAAFGAILEVEIRDPGGNMVEGFRPSIDRRRLPLTRMALSATSGETMVSVEPYNDYRGVPVVGAWTWLDRYGFGVGTEIDASEAYSALTALRQIFGGLFLLLAVASIGGAVYSYKISRLRRRTARAVAKAQRLGQYHLVKKIGAGGMGEVYLARHAMLRRATAVKLLRPERSSDHDIERFAREVQLTCTLTHPNTITIFDYGRTPNGVFYYAMEYLAGVSLDRVVKGVGPLPAARVNFILRQALGSLAEAHGAGLIHRDIKPANLMLCRQGGVADVVKVVDFGLVKSTVHEHTIQLTNPDVIAGTPLYLSPETIDSAPVDGRSDLYSLAAVGYFLLTGENVFEGTSAVQLVLAHAKEVPIPPSQRVDLDVPEDLEAVLLRALAKKPDDRYRTATEMRLALGRCTGCDDWDFDTGRRWWDEHGEELFEVGGDPFANLSEEELALDIDLGGRGGISDATTLR